MAQDQDSAKVPFGPWRTFKTFVEQDLKPKGVPTRVDNTVFRGKSGTDARHLRFVFKFFGLVQGESNDVTDRLRETVEAIGTDSWKDVLRGLLTAYDPIVKNVDIAKGTQGELDEAFRTQGGVSGSTLKKAVRFYLAAASEAGAKLSPHFVAVRVTSDNGDGAGTAVPRTGTPRPRRPKRQSATGDPGEPPPRMEGVDIVQPLPGRADFRFWIPKDLSPAEIDFGLKHLKDYLKLTRSQK